MAKPTQTGARRATTGNTTAPAERRQRADRRVKDEAPPPGVGERRAGPRRESDVLKPTCPFCGDSTSRVTRSRQRYSRMGDEAYHRQRRCAGCAQKFPTKELLDVEEFARMLAREGRSIQEFKL